MKNKILKFLKEHQGFVSGQMICENLGVSRTAVWKYINILKEEGYEIESVTRKGYRLLQSPNLLSELEVKEQISSETVPGEICCFPSVDSTNEEAKRRAAAGAPDGSLYVADNQTSGKGRRGRTWISPKGEDLFFSILLRPDLPTECASMLTIVAAAAAVETAEKYAGESCQIKWPNDIVLHKKKICGILTEMSADMDNIHYVVIGIGFNLNRTMFDDEIADMASSIIKETGKKISRTSFLVDYMTFFREKYDIFLKEQTLSPFMEEYNRHLINVNQQVRLIQKNQEIIRQAIGINEAGELIVEDEQGHRELIFTGEVSVRGLYGYV